MCGIVDIRIVALFVALSIARHAWIPPQRPALAVRWGQVYYVQDHCWAELGISGMLLMLSRLNVFKCNATVRVSNEVYIMRLYRLAVEHPNAAFGH